MNFLFCICLQLMMLMWHLIRKIFFECLLVYFYCVVGLEDFQIFLWLLSQIFKQRFVFWKNLILLFAFALKLLLPFLFAFLI